MFPFAQDHVFSAQPMPTVVTDEAEMTLLVFVL